MKIGTTGWIASSLLSYTCGSLLAVVPGVNAISKPNTWSTGKNGVISHNKPIVQEDHRRIIRREDDSNDDDVVVTHHSKSLSSSSTTTTTTNSVALSLVLKRLHRGGGCADSDSSLFVKLGVSAVLEAMLMLATIAGSVYLSDEYPNMIPRIFNLPVTQLMAAAAIIFGSSFFGSFIDGGISSATNQVLAPDVIPGDSKWYASLKKPSWNPPGYVFPIMWLIVAKPTQLCAVSRILKYGTMSKVDGSTVLPLGVLFVYCFHLALGDTWNKVFFGLQCPGRGAAVITAFYVCLWTSYFLFSALDGMAGKYLLPTCAWVTVATALQWYIYLNNKPTTKPKPKKKK